jgi:hypothetical protein
MRKEENIMKTIQNLLLICIIIAVPVLSSADDNRNRKDGYWWREYDGPTRAAYVVGFYAGMELGYSFSYWKFVTTENIKTDQCMSKMADSYNEYHLRYFKSVTTGQLVDGLDSFYADYRNRRILIVNAVYLVVNAVAGTPQEVMDAATEDLRRKAR